MDDLGANDPYRTMDSGEEGIQPDFLKKKNGKGGALAAAENLASAAIAAKTGKAPGKVGDNPISNAMKAEEKGGKSFYKGAGSKEGGEKQSGIKMSNGTKAAVAVAAPFTILLLGLLVIVFLIIGLPILMIGGIDYNLQKVLGFEHTVSVLEKVGETVTSEFMANGKMPTKYFNDLVANGIDVGQVTANGDFIRTDTYIANIEDRNDLVASASGFSYISEDEGELAMLYDGKVIYADDFIAKVESDPVLYAAYSDAADISTKYYYGDDVNDVYKEMGLSRGNFNNWESTGNYKADEKKYFEILNKLLDNGSDLVVGGAHRDGPKKDENNAFMEEDEAFKGSFFQDVTNGGTWEEDDVGAQEAEDTINQVAENTQEYVKKWSFNFQLFHTKKERSWNQDEISDDATKRAAELLNTAVSSSEPYLAANAFIAIEEPIQRARVDGDGPVNQVMNTLTQGKSVTYQNVETGSEETSKLSILETDNFRAAVSDSKYSKSEAQNFGRDRVLKTTEQGDAEIIKKTTVATDGKAKSSSVVRNGKTGITADADIIAKATENVSLSRALNNSATFQSIVGGNRIIEGGSYLSNTINMRVIAGMPSDEASIASYYEIVKETMARRAEAERATKNPFDISSPYTFLGSIVNNIAMASLKNYGAGMTALSAITSAGDTASKAVAVLTGNATAFGGDDEYITTSGEGCETVSAVGVEGDLYCSPHHTLSTDYVDYTFEDFKNSKIGSEIDDEGKPTGHGFPAFVTYGMDRVPTVGVRSADVCQRYINDHNESNNLLSSMLGSLFKNMTGLYDICADENEVNNSTYVAKILKPDLTLVPANVANGESYTYKETNGEENKLYGAYMMYDEVKSLLSDEESAVSKFKKEYYAKYPKDTSAAGIISSRSGMTKYEAEIALAYADYLDMIANYDPSTRFAFIAPLVVIEKPILQYHSDEVALNLYAWYSKQTEYDDLRTRNFVV